MNTVSCPAEGEIFLEGLFVSLHQIFIAKDPVDMASGVPNQNDECLGGLDAGLSLT
jgi:hypothetical protein